MKHRIALIGANGSMGRRYQAILKHLGVDYDCFDIEDWGLAKETVGITGIIIASPTECHYDNLAHFKNLKVPILCEKPITKDLLELREILEWDCTLTMVNQYDFLEMDGTEGATYYDFYNTGKDGIEWDCINIIGLAKGDVYINNQSPTWECRINGQDIDLSQVNEAYIDMVASWLESPVDNKSYIKKAHERVRENKYVKGRFRDTSEDVKHETAGQVQYGNKRQDDARMGNRSGAEIGAVHQQREPRDHSEHGASNTGGRPVTPTVSPQTGPRFDSGVRVGRTKPLSQGGGSTKPGLHGSDNE